VSLSSRVKKIEARRKSADERRVVYVVNEEDDASTRECKRKAALNDAEQKEGRALGDKVEFIQLEIVHHRVRSEKGVEQEPAKNVPTVQAPIVDEIEPQQPEQPKSAIEEPDWPERQIKRGNDSGLTIDDILRGFLP
jgi:hypothetical protein